MLELFYEINYLAVVVAGAAAFVISAVWYNIFGHAWMEENKFTKKDLTAPVPAMVKSFVSYCILAFGVASIFLLMKITGTPMAWLDGARWGIFLAVLIHGAAGLPNYFFENKSLTLFLIHIGNSMLGTAVIGAIVATWV